MTSVRTSPSGNLLEVGAAALFNLSNVFYVDRFTVVPSDQQDGNIETPFSTIAAAVAAAPSGSTVVVCAGDYSGEGIVALGTKSLSFRGEVGQVGIFATLPILSYSGSGQSITLRKCIGTLRSISGSVADIYLDFCPTADLQGAGNTSQVTSEGDSSGIVFGEGGRLFLKGLCNGYVANGGAVIGVAQGSVFGDLTSTSSIGLSQTSFGPGITITAPDIRIDNFSKKQAEVAGVTFVGTITIIGALANFDLPGLVIGSQGAQGVQTLVGDGAGGWMQGISGAGSQGPQGAQGSSGAQGPQGASGSGAQGPQGPQGASGSGAQGSSDGAVLFWGASTLSDDGEFLTPFDYSTAGTLSPFTTILYAPRDGTIGKAVFGISNTEGADTTATLTKGGVDTSIVATILNGQSIGYDAVNTVSVLKGDELRVRVDGNAGGNDPQFQVMYVDAGSGPQGPQGAQGATGSGTTIVASAIGRGTDGAAVPSTDLYTIPAGQSGLYRVTYFIGVATTNGTGDVQMTVVWPPYPPATGNLEFMSPGVGAGPTVPQASLTIGEGSVVNAPQTFQWWAEEGGVVSYSVSTSFSGGDWVWSVTLEKLSGFSNPP